MVYIQLLILSYKFSLQASILSIMYVYIKNISINGLDLISYIVEAMKS